MNLRVLFKPRAIMDLEQAVKWYDSHRVGLGDEFAIEFESTMKRIIERPSSFPMVEKSVRRAGTHRFPYSVLFSLETNQLVIHAVYHGKRAPRGWRS